MKKYVSPISAFNLVKKFQIPTALGLKYKKNDQFYFLTFPSQECLDKNFETAPVPHFMTPVMINFGIVRFFFGWTSSSDIIIRSSVKFSLKFEISKLEFVSFSGISKLRSKFMDSFQLFFQLSFAIAKSSYKLLSYQYLTPTLSEGTRESILLRVIFKWTFFSQQVLKCLKRQPQVFSFHFYFSVWLRLFHLKFQISTARIWTALNFIFTW